MKRGLLVALLCSIVWARAIEAKALDIPAGDLWIALEMLAKQTGAEIVYQIDQVRGLHTKGVSGDRSAEEAARRLIEGTPLVLRADSSGAMLIALPSAQHPSGSARELRPATDEPRKEGSPQSSSRLAAGAIPPATPSEPPKLQEVVVTGTLIRGVAPVGTNLITVGSDTVAATGASASGELLQMAIPQL